MNSLETVSAALYTDLLVVGIIVFIVLPFSIFFGYLCWRANKEARKC